MPGKHSPAKLEERRNRARARQYLVPRPRPPNETFVQVAPSVAPRVKAVAASLTLQEDHIALSGVHHPFARSATRAARGQLTRDAYKAAMQKHDLANLAKHKWHKPASSSSSSGAFALPSSPPTCGASLSADLPQPHAQCPQVARDHPDAPAPVGAPVSVDAGALKQIIGDKLYMRVAQTLPQHASKIVGMRLELGFPELVLLLDSSSCLQDRIEEAMSLIADDNHALQSNAQPLEDPAVFPPPLCGEWYAAEPLASSYDQLYQAQNNTIALLAGGIDRLLPSLRKVRALEQQVEKLRLSLTDTVQAKCETLIEDRLRKLSLPTDVHILKQCNAMIDERHDLLNQKLLPMIGTAMKEFTEKQLQSVVNAMSPACAAPQPDERPNVVGAALVPSIGDAVVIHGLQKSPELNGKLAHILSVGADGRYGIQLAESDLRVRGRPQCLSSPLSGAKVPLVDAPANAGPIEIEV